MCGEKKSMTNGDVEDTGMDGMQQGVDRGDGDIL